MTSSMYIATAAWICLVLAFLRRRSRRSHICFALSGIVSDIVLVGYLQLTRHAVQTAIAFKLGALQQTHIALSSVALLLYLPVVLLGTLLLLGRGGKKLRKLHKILALTALGFRTLGFAFMFSMLR